MGRAKRFSRRSLIVLTLSLAVVTGGRWLFGSTSVVGPQDFRVKTDNVPQATIAGRVFRAQVRSPRGTMIVCHGWHNSKEYCYGYDWVCKDPGWNMVCFDFREHGQSTHTRHLSSLGYHEIWDVKAVVDYCESQHLEKPYVIYGTSMGGSIGLRWAARDPRIVGVFACSPYRNALLASQRFIDWQLHLPTWVPTPFLVHPGFAWMLSRVDLPMDLRAGGRTDLRLTILAGQYDIFAAPDQRRILAACPSPPELKKLYIIPGYGHRWLFSWKGDRSIPSHDQLLKDFLASCE
jgi:pimeloyl-ACP methyl ester carboxylesterase